MNRKDIIIGLVVLALIAGGIFLFKRPKQAPLEIQEPSIEQKVEDKFNFVVPDDVDKTELKDAAGGDSFAVATRKYESGTFTHTLLADLPDPDPGYFYEGWLVRGREGDADFAFISTGRMYIAKGGYLLEFQSAEDYSDYKNVVVTLEKVNDQKPEKHVLEGAFE